MNIYYLMIKKFSYPSISLLTVLRIKNFKNSLEIQKNLSKSIVVGVIKMRKSKKSKILLSSDDFYRVLITDTQPYHMPIIFNNYGLYNAIDKSKKSIDFYEIFIKDLGLTNVNSSDFLNDKYTIPFEYQISKNIHSFRSLKLTHPLHQLKFVDFYRKFYTIILYNCGRSEFSLRYPSKVNSTCLSIKK